MAKVNVAEASGKILDWLVAKCMGVNEETFRLYYTPIEPSDLDKHGYPEFHYSSVFAQGGPIKEREGIATRRSKGKWYAMLSGDLGDGERAQWCKYTFRGVARSASTSRQCRFEGETELQASMRCYVASRMGEEVEVPDELT